MALFVTIALAGAPAVASAAQGTGSLASSDGRTTIIVGVAGNDEAGAKSPDVANAQSQARPFVYESVPHSSSGGNGLEHLCNAGNGGFDPNGGAVPWGWWYTIYLRDRATGQLVGAPQ